MPPLDLAPHLLSIAGAAAVLPVVPLALGQGGETAETATRFCALPFEAEGTTLGYADDDDAVCPYTGSTSPDVFYEYVAPADGLIRLRLCESGYDTKVYVRDVNGALVPTRTFDGAGACNDDSCSSAGGLAFRSLLGCVIVEEGETYRIAVDGWGGDAGPYEILVEAEEPGACYWGGGPCFDPCDGEPNEGEPCVPGAIDTFNGGCDGGTPAFSSLACGETVCGSTWSLPDGQFDADWYEIDTRAFATPVRMRAEGLLTDTAEWIVTGGDRIDCDEPVTVAAAVTIYDCLERGYVDSPILAPGLHYLRLRPTLPRTYGCDEPDLSRYSVTLRCTPLPACPPDVDPDGLVGLGDLLLVLSSWGTDACSMRADVDGDELVSFSDLLAVLTGWGPCG